MRHRLTCDNCGKYLIWDMIKCKWYCKDCEKQNRECFLSN